MLSIVLGEGVLFRRGPAGVIPLVSQMAGEALAGAHRPASCCFSTPMICSSVNRPFFISESPSVASSYCAEPEDPQFYWSNYRGQLSTGARVVR